MRAHFKGLDKIVLNSMDFNEKSIGKLFVNENKLCEISAMKDLNGEFGGLVLVPYKGEEEKPVGTIQINQNGTYDVTEYAEAEVNIPVEGYTPQDSLSILQNGNYNVIYDDNKFYPDINVNVPTEGYEPASDTLIIRDNGNYSVITPDDKFYNNVEVQVEGGETPDWFRTTPLTDGEKLTNVFLSCPPYTVDPSRASYVSFFEGLNTLTYLDVNNLINSNATNISYMFNNCASLSTVDGLDTWDTSNIVDMSQLFANCYSLRNLNTSSWDLSNVERAQSAFFSMISLESIDLSNATWRNLKNADNMLSSNADLVNATMGDWSESTELTSMNYIFQNCSSLQNISWQNVLCNGQYIYGVFTDCPALEEVDVDGWTLPEAIHIDALFSNCASLTHVDLSSWSVPKLENFHSIFSGCTELREVNLNGWTITPVALYNTFGNCTNLELIDMRTMNLENTAFDMTFEGIPLDCTIIVKNQASKDRILSYYPNLTGVITAEEYEG